MSSSNGEKSASELAAGTVLQDRYRVVRPLGRGGMGAVYEALDLRLDATVAIKETFSTDDHLRKQFAREARMLAHLHHPSLPRVSDYFIEGDRAFLVMQFIEGVDLARIMAQQPGPFPLQSVVAWADQLLDALVYLHSRDRQVIHRDIKPHNLKLTPEGKIALLDFGLAKAQPRQDAGATSSAAIFGYTKQYAPLEQMQDLETGPRSDIYALGATLYHLLTGVKPPDALTRAAALVQSRPDPLRPANEVQWAIGAEIAAVLKRAMAQSADDRYANASDFRNALRAVGRAGMSGRRQVQPESSGADERSQLISAPGQGEEAEATQAAPTEYPRTSYRGRVLAAAAIVLAAITAAAFYRSDMPTADPAAVKTSQPKIEATPAAAASTHTSKPARANSQKPEPAPTNQIIGPGKTTVNEVSQAPVTALPARAGQTGASQPGGGSITPVRPAQQAQHAAVRTPKAPSIRFPIPDFQRTYPVPVPVNSAVSEQHTYEPADRRPAANSEARQPEILRARDGTQIIRFPDGSTRVFRPGERTH